MKIYTTATLTIKADGSSVILKATTMHNRTDFIASLIESNPHAEIEYEAYSYVSTDSIVEKSYLQGKGGVILENTHDLTDFGAIELN